MSEASYLDTVSVEHVDSIAVLRLNRPHRNNAWNGKMPMAY